MRCIVLGIDGAGFTLLDQWLPLLPNLRYIKESGFWTDLQSFPPPVTAPNWKCYSTGLNPGRFGIFYWENIKWGKVYFPNERKTQTKEIWDYLSEAGYKVGVFGVPTTYPPKVVNGWFVSGPPDRLDTGFTYPKHLQAKLKADFNYESNTKESILINRDRAAEELLKKVLSDLEIFRQVLWQRALGDDWDFLQLTCFWINELHHYLWDDEITFRAWMAIDELIGFILDHKYNLLIMSDHGSCKIDKVLNINTWLQKKGYLKLKNSSTGIMSKLGLTKERLSGLPGAVIGKRLFPNLVDKIPSVSGHTTDYVSKEDSIDWNKSTAVASDQGPIYIKDKKLAVEIGLEIMSDVSTIEGCFEGRTLYKGNYVEEAPQIILSPKKGTHISGGLGVRDVITKPNRWLADNWRYGIFMGLGPDIKLTGNLKNVSILDLAPTILDMYGIKVELDGKSLIN